MPWNVLTRHSGKSRRIESCARLSGVIYSLLIADHRFHWQQQRTAVTGVWDALSLESRHLERKTTRTCHNRCGVSVCKEHSALKGRDHRTSPPYQQRHLMTLTPARELRRTIFCRTVPLYIAVYFLLCSEFQRTWYFNKRVPFLCC